MKRAESVDIILATYNGSYYIEEQLKSLIDQTYSNTHIYITDDGSTDGTLDIVQSVVEKYKISNKVSILPFRDNELKGPANNFIYGLSFSKSKYIMFCDQDDIWLNNKIEVQLGDILKLDNTRPAISFCDASLVDKSLNQIHPSFINSEGFNVDAGIQMQNLVFQNITPGCCMIFNDKLRDLFFSSPNRKHIVMHDWYLMILCSIYGSISYTDSPLMLYRQHGRNQVGASKNLDLSSVSKIKYKVYQSYRNHLNAKCQAVEIANSLPSVNINCSFTLLTSVFNKSYFTRLLTLIKLKVKKSSFLKTLVLYLYV
ncbi:glycosyltransferase family 2 protein [Vibrio vulnificus]|uniref:glycosyltransferase family 2 protein n=1 Tax=Vibrio vulnificus TaxID=672 RepID=UPI000CD0A4C0|nr:glycosyltransferase family 2 protein [Vibrio vulnificus]POC14873.1 hypothetical protein CRN39_03690 [Vibrio vulnificus]